MVTAQHETEALQIPNCQAYDGFQLRVDSFGAQEALLRLLGPEANGSVLCLDCWQWYQARLVSCVFDCECMACPRSNRLCRSTQGPIQASI